MKKKSKKETPKLILSFHFRPDQCVIPLGLNQVLMNIKKKPVKYRIKPNNTSLDIEIDLGPHTPNGQKNILKRLTKALPHYTQSEDTKSNDKASSLKLNFHYTPPGTDITSPEYGVKRDKSFTP